MLFVKMAVSSGKLGKIASNMAKLWYKPIENLILDAKYKKVITTMCLPKQMVHSLDQTCFIEKSLLRHKIH